MTDDKYGIENSTRASDAQRRATADKLRQARTEGRLSEEHFDARMHAVLEAVTASTLDRMVGDLPAPPIDIDTPWGYIFGTIAGLQAIALLWLVPMLSYTGKDFIDNSMWVFLSVLGTVAVIVTTVIAWFHE